MRPVWLSNFLSQETEVKKSSLKKKSEPPSTPKTQGTAHQTVTQAVTDLALSLPGPSLLPSTFPVPSQPAATQPFMDPSVLPPLSQLQTQQASAQRGPSLQQFQPMPPQGIHSPFGPGNLLDQGPFAQQQIVIQPSQDMYEVKGMFAQMMGSMNQIGARITSVEED